MEPQTVQETRPSAPRQLPFSVREAVTAADRKRVFAFRYGVYIREMGRVQHYADHAREAIEEPLDATAHLYLAEAPDGEIVGTVRTNYSRDRNLGAYPDIYRMHWALETFPEACSVSTKMIVGRRYRSGLRSGWLGCALAQASYRHALSAGVLLDFCDCSTPAIVSFFRHLGYRRYHPDVVHPEFGEVRLLVLLMRDLDFITRANSPFASDLGRVGPTLGSPEPASRALQAYREQSATHDFLEE